MGDVGRVDRLMHRQQRDRVRRRRAQLADQPGQLVSGQLPALGDVGVEPDDPQPGMLQRPVHVGLPGRWPWRRDRGVVQRGDVRAERRHERIQRGADRNRLGIGIVVPGYGEDRRSVVGIRAPELCAISVLFPVRVDEVAEVVEEACRLRPVELARDRARHPALGQRIDVTAAVPQRVKPQFSVPVDRVGVIRADHLVQLDPIGRLPDRIRQRHERSVGNDRSTPGEQLQRVGSAGGARPIVRQQMRTRAIVAAHCQTAASMPCFDPVTAIRRSSSSAPALCSGSLRLPHLGDCTHDGHPDRHGHSPISRRASATSISNWS